MLIQVGAGEFIGAGLIDVSGGPGGFGNLSDGRPAPGSPGVVTLNVVPEPASLVFLGIGLLTPMGAWGFRLGRARAPG